MAALPASESIPTLALLGAGIFVKDQYVGILRSLTDTIRLQYVWSRSQAPAEDLRILVQDYASVKALYGEDGLEEILKDPSLDAEAVVLPAQAQPQVVLRALKAGKHVIQEKPVAPNLRAALEVQQALGEGRGLHIWAVAENYRFEPALMEAARMVAEIGRVALVEVVVELPMTEANPYFSSEWRRDPALLGAFMVDGGVHFLAGTRMIVGSEVALVSSTVAHMDARLPPPDNLAAVMSFENGALGVLAMSYSATSRRVSWRVVGAHGTVEAQRGHQDGQQGYSATLTPAGNSPRTVFHPFQGVQEELRAFARDVALAAKEGGRVAQDPRSSALEAMRDLAAVEALVQAGMGGGAQVRVQQVS